MRWINIKKDELVGLECINPKNDKHILRLSPNSKNMKKDERDDSDARIISIIVKNKPTLLDIKKHLLYLQAEYDISSEVNSFYIDGNRVWFDKLTRIGISKAINDQRILGNDKYSVWFNNTALELTLDKAELLLAKIEDYAGKCYNVTQQHLYEIKNLSSIEDCLSYDVTAGYPNMLNISLND